MSSNSDKSETGAHARAHTLLRTAPGSTAYLDKGGALMGSKSMPQELLQEVRGCQLGCQGTAPRSGNGSQHLCRHSPSCWPPARPLCLLQACRLTQWHEQHVPWNRSADFTCLDRDCSRGIKCQTLYPLQASTLSCPSHGIPSDLESHSSFAACHLF